MVTTINAILKTPIQKLGKTISSFRITHEAAFRNIKTLVSFNGDLGAAIVAQKDIPLKYGLEFRDTAALTKLLFYHEYRVNIINIIHQGSRYCLDPIEEETRKLDLDAMILRGDHKSSHSEMNSAEIDKAISKYIDHGWALPLTIEYLKNIKNTGVVPMGVA